MSYNAGLVPCPELQNSINVLFGANLLRETHKTNFIDVVASDANKSRIMEFSLSPGGGKKKIVTAIYKHRSGADIVTNTINTGCTATYDDRPDFSTTYELNRAYSVGRTVNLGALADICKSNPQYIEELVMDMMSALKLDINNYGLSVAKASLGNFATTGNATAIAGATETTTGAYSPDYASRVHFEMAQNEYDQRVFLFHNNYSLMNYYRNNGVAGVDNTSLGINLNRLLNTNDVVPVMDFNMNANYSADTTLQFAFAKGAIQFVNFNVYDQEGLSNVGADIYGTIQDPLTAMKFNFVRRQCGLDLTFELSTEGDYFTLPTDMYASTDRLNGVTLINEFKVTNPA